MTMPLNPEQLAAVQAVSHHIKGKITIDYEESSVNVALTSENEEAKALLPNLISQLAEALAIQLTSYFAIEGKIVEKNKPKEPVTDGSE